MKLWIAAACALVAAPAAAQTLQDGLHTCAIGSFVLGEIDIRGGTYAGPAFDGAFEAYYPFTRAGDTITWGGPLGGISGAGTIVSTVLKNAGDNRAGFDVTIRNAEGNFQTVSCYPS